MVWRYGGYLCTKFGINSLFLKKKNAFYGRTDARAVVLALLTQSSRAKNRIAGSKISKTPKTDF